ncbi:MAG: M28 family metallopeptidase, partial [Spirochaetes bacterium]|nr:M28 family metallopeptidase [Spirochaetota bacterium]
RKYLDILCHQIEDRSVGSAGNRQATLFFKNKVEELGWITEIQEFSAMDWAENGVQLEINDQQYQAKVSPYSLGCEVEAELVAISSLEELEQTNITNKIVFLHSEIAQEQLMPKNFVFYNPAVHQKIIAELEKSQPKAIIAATGRNSALAGGVYPFPLIEDGDFDIPSVYLTEEEGKELLPLTGSKVYLKSSSQRIPGKGYNVIAQKGSQNQKKVVLTAHIDAKKGTPGAIDNATGVILLLLLAELLQDYRGNIPLDLIAFNGEDYYAVPGQMAYIQKNQNQFSNILFDINIDGAGYKEGHSAYSFYDLPVELEKKAKSIFAKYPGILPGAQWPQGDHSIFLQYGTPAIALTSQWFTDNMGKQTITHTPQDNSAIVDCKKIAELAQGVADFILNL